VHRVCAAYSFNGTSARVPEITGRPVPGRREDAPRRPPTPNVESLTHRPGHSANRRFGAAATLTDRMDSFKQFHILKYLRKNRRS
jgi:hypothetical protein